VDHAERGVPVLALDFAERVMGRPGFVQGGALSGLLEIAAIVAVQTELARRGDVPQLKPVNVTIDFMRNAEAQRTFAVGRVIRAGRRLVNVTAEAWQADRERVIASAWMNVMLAPVKG
jgi:acyl-coenzyme A thioesterase PaaI-like protein